MEKRTPPGFVYSCAISPKISTKIVSLKFSPIHFGKLRYSNFNFFFGNCNYRTNKLCPIYDAKLRDITLKFHGKKILRLSRITIKNIFFLVYLKANYRPLN